MVEVGGFEPVLGSSSINLLRTLQFWVFSSLEIKEPLVLVFWKFLESQNLWF